MGMQMVYTCVICVYECAYIHIESIFEEKKNDSETQ